VNSTWRDDSLFGLDPLLASRLLAELPYDEFRIALVLHPNVWVSHSRLQIESWLFGARRAGLILLPPDEGWRAAVIASDWVLSDHGSVGMYAAAVGRPVLLEQSGRPAVDPRSGLGRLFEAAPALDPFAPIRPQLALAERLRDRTHAVARAWVSSAPERSLRLIRAEAYRIIGAPPPATEPALLAVEPPAIDDAPPTSLWTRVEQVDGALHVRRTPATVTGPAPPPESTLIVSDQELDHRLSGLADVIGIRTAALPADEETWSAAAFAHRPGVRLTVVHDACRARMRTRDGRTIALTLESIGHSGDAELVFAVLAGRALTDTIAPGHLAVRVSPERTVTADVRVCDA
jgi:hypothetical protein